MRKLPLKRHAKSQRDGSLHCILNSRIVSEKRKAPSGSSFYESPYGVTKSRLRNLRYGGSLLRAILLSPRKGRRLKILYDNVYAIEATHCPPLWLKRNLSDVLKVLPVTRLS